MSHAARGSEMDNPLEKLPTVTPHSDLSDLEQQRSLLHAGLAAVGDFRPGSLSAVMRRCGKRRCACADPAHLGHGPQHILTKKVAGKTVAVHLKAGTELEKVAGEVANYNLFKQIVGEIVEVSEAICRARPVVPLADAGQPPTHEANFVGPLVYAKARPRGCAHAGEVVALGDMAPWIWSLAKQHFPGATQIVDL
jgi:hypothetical protein